MMKSIIALSLLGLAIALPQQQQYEDPSLIPIIRSEFLSPDESGAYSVDFETGDGIRRSESGVGSAASGAVESQGIISFTHPDGTPNELKFIANAKGGFQPQSDLLPVSVAFPHEIPAFVLEQIRFAQEEDRNRVLDPARGDWVGY